MKVIMKRPHEEPQLLDIENDLKTLHEAVEGFFEVMGSKEHSGNYIYNETPHACGLTKNCTVEGRTIYGTFIYVGAFAGDFTDVPAEDVALYELQRKHGTLGTERWLWS